MSLDTSQWITLGTFVGTQALGLVYTVVTLKADARVMRAQMDNMEKELSGVQKTLEALADVRADMRLMQERGLAQSLRVDELQRWINQQRDRAEAREH